MTLAISTLSKVGPVRLSHRSLTHILSTLCIATALILFGNTLWIYAKAQLAQVLLERAFTQSIVLGVPVKAWSWADTWPVARIEIGRLQASAIVLQGGSGEALAFGPALLNETSRIGERGTAVIAAHRDTHFAFLKDAAIGDVISITRDDGVRFTYRVTGTSIVDWNRSGIDAHADGFNLVLATCYPFGAITHGPLRYLVKAELAPSSPSSASSR
jgi:sortase A